MLPTPTPTPSKKKVRKKCGQLAGLGSLGVVAWIISGADYPGYLAGKKSCNQVFSCFLDFHQDGLRRFSGNEYVLAAKRKFCFYPVRAL